MVFQRIEFKRLLKSDPIAKSSDMWHFGYKGHISADNISEPVHHERSVDFSNGFSDAQHKKLIHRQ